MLGKVSALDKDRLAFLTLLYLHYGTVVHLHILHHHAYVVNRPEIHQILVEQKSESDRFAPLPVAVQS